MKIIQYIGIPIRLPLGALTVAVALPLIGLACLASLIIAPIDKTYNYRTGKTEEYFVFTVLWRDGYSFVKSVMRWTITG